MSQQQRLQHHYEGAGFLRQRLLLATLTGVPVRISRMHLSPPFAGAAAPADSLASGSSPLLQPHVRGVQPYEASLLRLLCSVTEGSRVHINAAGTTLTYYPGQLIGCDPDKLLGAPLVHHCHCSKPISYYVEPLLLLAPFCKHPLNIRLTGVTDLDTHTNRNISTSNNSRERTQGVSSDGGSTSDTDANTSDTDVQIRTSSGSNKDGAKYSEASKNPSDSSGWNFVCADAPIDFVRSVTIPTLQRLLRLTTTARTGARLSAESNTSDSHSSSRGGQEENVARRTTELPEPFYLLRVLRRCCGSRAAAVGAAAGGVRNGEVLLKTHGILREPLQPFVWLDVGRVKRIRGTAFAAGGISPLFAKRCISRARCIFNLLLPDVWIYLEKPQPGQKGAARNAAAGRTAVATVNAEAATGRATAATGERREEEQQQGSGECVGLALVAETIRGNYKGAAGLWCVGDAAATVATGASSGGTPAAAAADAWRASGSCKLELLLKQCEDSGDALAAATHETSTDGTGEAEEEEGGRSEAKEEEGGAEKLAEVTARRLLLEVQQGGVVDTAHQYMPLLFAALAEEHAVSRIRLSRLTPYAVQFIRHLRDFLGVVFHVEEEATGTTSFDFNQSQQHQHEQDDAHSSVRRSAGVTLKCVGVGLKNMARATF